MHDVLGERKKPTTEELELNADLLEEWVEDAKVKLFVRRAVDALRTRGVLIQEPERVEAMKEGQRLLDWVGSYGKTVGEPPVRVYAANTIIGWICDLNDGRGDWTDGELLFVLNAVVEEVAESGPGPKVFG
jgi:hypothetical protein